MSKGEISAIRYVVLTKFLMVMQKPVNCACYFMCSINSLNTAPTGIKIFAQKKSHIITIFSYNPYHVIPLLPSSTPTITSVLASIAIHGRNFIIIKIQPPHSTRTKKAFIPAPPASTGAAPTKLIKEIHKKQHTLIITFLLNKTFFSYKFIYFNSYF